MPRDATISSGADDIESALIADSNENLKIDGLRDYK